MFSWIICEFFDDHLIEVDTDIDELDEAFYGEESFNEEELRELSDEFEKDREEGI